MFERLRADRLPSRAVVWYVLDVLLAAALVALTIESARATEYVADYGGTTGRQWWWLLAPSIVVAFRRSAPLSALAIATVAYALAQSAGAGNATLAIPFLVYAVALSRPSKVSGALVAVSAVVASSTSWFAGGESPALTPLYFFLFFLVGWVIGVRVRSNQLRAERLRAEAATAREEAAVAVERAIADERARIARELHDAVGHAVNVMVLQAGALRLATTDERSAGSLREIERVGRAALSDLDRMLGLLGADDEPAPLEPAHGVDDIPTLVDGLRSAGLTVRFEGGCQGALDESIERPISAAAYRIVQEALTNALKHAGPATVEVALSCDDEELCVSVVDDGRGAAAGAGTPERVGRGLAGMNERVAVLGGRLVAGPRTGGGFRVVAHLPRSRDHR